MTSSQIEDLLNMTNGVDTKKLSAVVGGLESQLESIKRSGDPRPPSSGNSMLQHQQEPSHQVIMRSGQQATHSQAVSYIAQSLPNSFQHSNVVSANGQQRIVVGAPRHPSSQPVPVTFIQGTPMNSHIQLSNIQQVAVNSGQMHRLPVSTSASGNRQMVVFPQNLPSNAVFQLNGQQILFLPRGPQGSGNGNQPPVVAVQRNAMPTMVKQQPGVAPAIQTHSQNAMGNLEDLAARGRKFLQDLVNIATKTDPQAGGKISRLIDEVKNGQKQAAAFVTEVQSMFPIVVRTGDESQSQIDQSTLVMMVHAAIAPGGVTGRSTTPQTVNRTTNAQQMNMMQQQQQQQHHLQQQQQSQMQSQIQQQGMPVRIAGGVVQQGQTGLVAGVAHRSQPASQMVIGQQHVLVPNQPPIARPPIMRNPSQQAMTSQQQQPPPQMNSQQPQIQQRPNSSNQLIQRHRIKEEQDMSDVGAMSGVEIIEEKMISTNSQSFMSQQQSQQPQRSGTNTQSPPRMSREQPVLAAPSQRPASGSVVARLHHIVGSNGLSLPPVSSQPGATNASSQSGANELVNLLALATQSYLKDFVEQMAVVCAHRLYNLKTDSARYEQIGDMRAQLRAIERIEQKMIDQVLNGGLRSTAAVASSENADGTEETNAVLSAAIGTTRPAADPAKGTDQDSARQREANATALAAIGGASRRWLNKKADTGNSTSASVNTPPPSGAIGVEDSESSRAAAQQQQQRARRANLSDVLFVLNQHPRLSRHPTLIYKYTNLSGK